MYYLVFILMFFASVAFFNPHQMFSESLAKAIFLLITVAAFVLAITDRRYPMCHKNYPQGAYWLMLTFIGISPVMAGVFHGQELSYSIITVLPFFCGYLWFFILWRYGLSEKQVMRVILVGCAIAVPLFILNLRAFPNTAFGFENIYGDSEERGMLRIQVFFIELFPLVLCYAISRWQMTRKWYWIVVALVAVTMITVSLIRQIILVSFALAFIMLLRPMTWSKRIIAIVIIGAAAVVVVPRISIFKALSEVSEVQKELNDRSDEGEDIRVQAWRYYIYQYQPSVATMILGNGVPSLGKTHYGVTYLNDMNASKCIESDVGWAGFFFFFGGISTVALFIWMLRTVMMPKPKERSYVSYGILFVMITAVASGPILYYNQIFAVCVMMYLAYAPSRRHAEDMPELAPAEADAGNLNEKLADEDAK